MSVEIYQIKVVNEIKMPYSLGGIRPITEIMLFDEGEPRGQHWMTMEGSPRVIGQGQGKWYIQQSTKTVVLLDDTGTMTVGSFDYERWVLRKGDVGKIRFKQHEFSYLVVYDR